MCPVYLRAVGDVRMVDRSTVYFYTLCVSAGPVRQWLGLLQADQAPVWEDTTDSISTKGLSPAGFFAYNTFTHKENNKMKDIKMNSQNNFKKSPIIEILLLIT